MYPNVTNVYDRMAALIDVSDNDSYVRDVFRVAGGTDHAKFFLSHFGAITHPSGLSMQPATDYAHPQMRNFQVARAAGPGWSVQWKVEDRYKLLPEGRDVRVRYTDFTRGADVYTCEAWVVAGTYNSTTGETWMPRLMVRRRSSDAKAPLTSTFVSLIEPHDGGKPLIARAARLPLNA